MCLHVYLYIHTMDVSQEAPAAVQVVPGTVCLIKHLLNGI